MIKRVYIEITNRCNLRCGFCDFHHRPFRDMTLQEFRHCAMQAMTLTPYLYLHVQGEPLLHPCFDEIMSICDELGTRVQLVTNGTMLGAFMDVSRHSSLRKLSISMQSAIYQANPMETLHNAIDAMRKCEERGIYAEIRFWRNDQSDNPLIRRMLEMLGNEFDFSPTSRSHSLRLSEKIFLSYDNSFSWPNTSQQEIGRRGTCLGTRGQLAVLVDGTVVPCCLDSEGNIAFGNIFMQSMEEIMASKRFSAMHDSLENGILNESLCRKCSFRLRFNKQ